MPIKFKDNVSRILSLVTIACVFGWILTGCDSKVPTYDATSMQQSANSSSTAGSGTASDATGGSSNTTNGSSADSTSGTSGTVGSSTSKTMPSTNKSSISPDTVATLHTNLGDIEIRFFPDKAPKTVESFLTLAKKGFYDKTKFHRVIPGFMIQGGDPLTVDDKNRSLDGTGGPGYTVPAEFNDVSFERGIVGLARSQDVNSGGSQFFIMVAAAHHLNEQYTAFGQVIKGMDVADKIVKLPRDSRDNPNPKNPAIIEKITISQGDPKTFPTIPLIKKS